MNLSKTSTLYRSAEFNFKIFGNWNTNFKYYIPAEFCSFFREYIFRLVRNTFLAFMLGFTFVSMILTSIEVVFLRIGLGNTFIDVFGFLGWLASAVIGFMLLLYALVEWVDRVDIPTPFKRKYDEEGNRIYGPVRTYYNAWKNKHCPLLNITE